MVNMEVVGMKVAYIGNGIQAMRREIGMSQRELADRLGIPRYQLSHLENGRVIADWETIKKLAEILGCTLGDLYRPAVLDLIRKESHGQGQ